MQERLKKTTVKCVSVLCLCSMACGLLASCKQEKPTVTVNSTAVASITTEKPQTTAPVTTDSKSDEKVDAVISAIEAIPSNITLAHRDVINSANAAYGLLSKKQKESVSDKLTKKLNDALEKLEALRKAADTGDGIYLSDIEWLSWKMYRATSEDKNPIYRPSRNQNEAGGRISIAGIEYPKGLRTHPDINYDAEFVYDISSYGYTTFSATVGKDSAAKPGYGTVQFFIYGDGKLLATSPLLDVGSSSYIACDVTGVKTLVLAVSAVDSEIDDSCAFGYAMLSNRPCSPSDAHMEEYLTERSALKATDGVVYDADDRSVIFNGADQQLDINVSAVCNVFSAVVENNSDLPVEISLFMDNKLFVTFTIKKGIGEEIKYVLKSGKLTIKTDGNSQNVIFKEAKLKMEEKKEEIFADPVEYSHSTEEKYRGWINDLATLPVSFVYDGVKYFGLGSDDFTEISRKVSATKLSERTLITVKHKASGVDITLDAVFYPNYNAYEWTLYFANNTDKRTGIFSDIRGAEMYLFGSDPTLYGIRGDGIHEYYGEYTKKVTSVLTDQSALGKPTQDVFPYYRFDTSDNIGVFIAVSWGGRYQNRFAPVEGGEKNVVRFTASQLELSCYLDPGECIRSPLVAFLEYDETTEETGISNLWRRFMIDCNMHRVDGEVIQPMITASASWIYDCMTNATEESQIEAIRSYFDYGIALDYWWMDAGWYTMPSGSKINAWAQTGTWNVDKNRFPTEFKSISDLADDLNMRGTILWFEPERVNFSASDIQKIHPEFKSEWLIRIPGDPNSLLDLSNRECREWLVGIVSSIMEKGGIDIYRQDFNFHPANSWSSLDSYGRVGFAENMYVQGYYAYFDALLERFPNMYIDTCASGGNRMELETIRRAVALHRTDANVDDSTRTQAATQGLYNWIPFSGHPMNASLSTTFDIYQIRSTYLPSVTLNYDYRVTTAEWKKLSALVEECRMAMKYCYNDYYELVPWNNTVSAWRGWEFINSAENEGVIQLFCPEGCSELSKTIKLYGLDPNVVYVLTDVEGINSCKMSGKELMEVGFTVTYSKTRSSSVIFINTKEIEVPDLQPEKALVIPEIPKGAVVVSDLEWSSWKMIASSSDNPASPYAPSFNKNEAGGTLIIGGYSFKKGIRSHPDASEPAQVVYDISKYSDKYTKFFAFVGKDSAGGAGNIQFSVLVDGKEVAVSDVLSFGQIGYVEADISGGKTLTLVFSDGGDGYFNDSSAFGNPMLMTDEDLADYKESANLNK